MLEQRLSEGERVFREVDSALEELEETPGRKRNLAAEGLINDVREHVQEIEPGPALDAVLIAALQKVEHYCIAAWGTAKAVAQATGQKNAIKAMERALKEGAAFDEQLTRISEEEILPELLSGAEDQEETDEESASESGGTRSRGQRNGGAERRAAK